MFFFSEGPFETEEEERKKSDFFYRRRLFFLFNDKKLDHHQQLCSRSLSLSLTRSSSLFFSFQYFTVTILQGHFFVLFERKETKTEKSSFPSLLLL